MEPLAAAANALPGAAPGLAYPESSWFALGVVLLMMMVSVNRRVPGTT